MSVARHGVYGYTTQPVNILSPSALGCTDDKIGMPSLIGLSRVQSTLPSTSQFAETTEPGDKVRHPGTIIGVSDRSITRLPMRRKPTAAFRRIQHAAPAKSNGRYEMDFDDLERKKTADPAVKIALLCR